VLPCFDQVHQEALHWWRLVSDERAVAADVKTPALDHIGGAVFGQRKKSPKHSARVLGAYVSFEGILPAHEKWMDVVYASTTNRVQHVGDRALPRLPQ
jgi:hypothetical protein